MTSKVQSPITYEVATLQAWPKTAQMLVSHAEKNYTWCFKGDLGAGKTTLIQAICAHLNIQEPVTSPTYSLINEYHTPSKKKIYHCDFYRLNNIQEAIQIGFESYLEHDYYTFIEWPQLIEPLLPKTYFEITIQAIDLLVRTITAVVKNNT